MLEVISEVLFVLEAFASKPPTDLKKIVRPLSSEIGSVQFKVALFCRRVEPLLPKSFVRVNDATVWRICV